MVSVSPHWWGAPAWRQGGSWLPTGAKPGGPCRGDKPASRTASLSREGQVRRGGGKAPATGGLSCSSCPQASGSTAEGRRRGGGYRTVLRQPHPSSPSQSCRLKGLGSRLILPPVSAALPSVTCLPLLFAPQTRERGRPVAAGRLWQDAPSRQPVSGGVCLCQAVMLRGTRASGKYLRGGLCREERS